jgi:hypothetical protein
MLEPALGRVPRSPTAVPSPALDREVAAALRDLAISSGHRTVDIRVRVQGGRVRVEILGPPVRDVTDGDGATFAHWLSTAMEERALTSRQTAAALGVSSRTVSRWLNGWTEPRLRELRRITAYFGAAR